MRGYGWIGLVGMLAANESVALPLSFTPPPQAALQQGLPLQAKTRQIDGKTFYPLATAHYLPFRARSVLKSLPPHPAETSVAPVSAISDGKKTAMTSMQAQQILAVFASSELK